MKAKTGDENNPGFLEYLEERQKAAVVHALARPTAGSSGAAQPARDTDLVRWSEPIVRLGAPWGS